MKQDLFAWPEVEGDANIHGPLSFAVPSAVAGYAHMHGRWGVLPLSEVMAPALALAQARACRRTGSPRSRSPTPPPCCGATTRARRIYLPGGLPPVAPYQGSPGFFQLGPAAGHAGAAWHGAGLRDFYEGDVAATLAADFAAVGSLLTADDLRRCEARIVAGDVRSRGRGAPCSSPAG